MALTSQGSQSAFKTQIPIYTSTSVGEGKAAYAYSNGSITGVAGGGITYTAEGLPAGLSINASTGAITGTPTVNGTFSFTSSIAISGTNIKRSNTHSITIIPNTPEIFPVSNTVASGETNTAKTISLSASEGATISISAGSIPGLSFSNTNANTATYSGTLGANGTYSFTVQAVAPVTGITVTKTYGIVITPNIPSIAGDVGTVNIVGSTTSSSFTVYANKDANLVLSSGSIPGVTFTKANTTHYTGSGLISTAGTYTLNWTATAPLSGIVTTATSTVNVTQPYYANTRTATTETSITIPATVTSINIMGVGGGGAGGDANVTAMTWTGGGGGGAFAWVNGFPVTAGDVITFTAGAGGTIVSPGYGLGSYSPSGTASYVKKNGTIIFSAGGGGGGQVTSNNFVGTSGYVSPDASGGAGGNYSITAGGTSSGGGRGGNGGAGTPRITWRDAFRQKDTSGGGGGGAGGPYGAGGTGATFNKGNIGTGLYPVAADGSGGAGAGGAFGSYTYTTNGQGGNGGGAAVGGYSVSSTYPNSQTLGAGALRFYSNGAFYTAAISAGYMIGNSKGSYGKGGAGCAVTSAVNGFGGFIAISYGNGAKVWPSSTG